ncbi:MAG TPA: prepilin peptidase [Caulobacteraceae bacterium]
MDLIAYALVIAFALLVIVAALKDVTSFTIPNWISAALIVAFFAGAAAAKMPPAGIGMAAAVGVCALVAGMALFAFNIIGGGDAKLLAAVALWMSWPAILPFLLATALAGGVLALVLIQLRSDMMKTYLARGPAWVGRLAAAADAPYGLAIAIGALVTLPQSPLVLHLAG